MIRKLIQTTVCAAALLLGVPALNAAPTVPTTAAEHFGLAKHYQEQAAARHKEAQEHREMAEAYKRSTVDAHKAYGQRNPWVVKMEKHCNAIATAAEKLAVQDEKAAEFHTFRGKELQGK